MSTKNIPLIEGSVPEDESVMNSPPIYRKYVALQFSCMESDEESDTGFVSPLEPRSSMYDSTNGNNFSNIEGKSDNIDATSSQEAEEGTNQSNDEPKTTSNDLPAPESSNETDESTNDSQQALINDSSQQTMEGCGRVLSYAKKFRICYTTCIHIFLMALSIFSMFLGLTYWNQCNFATKCMLVLLKGLFILGVVILSPLSFLSAHLNISKYYLAFKVLACICAFGILSSTVFEFSVLPSSALDSFLVNVMIMASFVESLVGVLVYFYRLGHRKLRLNLSSL
ncbi:hypothetical protein TNCT_61861 [Trichonephila clavata]|uniref:Uncharacterized protein n=1 Tax=Trichonephila clavata TaxID=2740835 RepID=A0A8X6GBH1_TRICU|nr:hypothetical protein TNCT_61861 [Trichonephila clavata]